jgi:hypothetical protein
MNLKKFLISYILKSKYKINFIFKKSIKKLVKLKKKNFTIIIL